MPDDILPKELHEHNPVRVPIQFDTEVPTERADLDAES